MYGPEDLVVVDNISWLRRNIRLYLREGYEPSDLCEWLAEECRLSCGSTPRILSDSSWFIVESKIDWLEGAQNPYHQLTPLPNVGPNSVSLLMATVAFAAHVSDWCEGGWSSISGELIPSVVMDQETRRAVAFSKETISFLD